MKIIQLLFYVFFVFLCRASDKEKKTKVQNSHPKYSWSTTELMRYFTKDTHSLIVNELSSKGFFRPNDTCAGFVQIGKHKNKPNEVKISQKDSLEKELYKLCAFLYTNAPQYYIDTGLTDKQYQITEKRLKQALVAAQNGRLTMMCGEYALFVQLFLKMYLPNVRTAIASMDTSMGYGIDHTVCIVFLHQSNKAIVVDPMFGYIYSCKINDSNTSNLLFLPEDILRKKRFLTNRIWPCNFTHPEAEYYFRLKKVISNMSYNGKKI